MRGKREVGGCVCGMMNTGSGGTKKDKHAHDERQHTHTKNHSLYLFVAQLSDVQQAGHAVGQLHVRAVIDDLDDAHVVLLAGGDAAALHFQHGVGGVAPRAAGGRVDDDLAGVGDAEAAAGRGLDLQHVAALFVCVVFSVGGRRVSARVKEGTSVLAAGKNTHQNTIITRSHTNNTPNIPPKHTHSTTTTTCRPTRRGRYQVPPDSGTMPRLVKAAASLALLAMMRISQPSAVSMP